MQGRLAVPVHNVAGELVSYIGRPLESGSDLHPKGFNARRELYNLSRVLAHHANEQELVIVPDIFDVWRLHEIGKHAVIAPLGRLLSVHQVELLRNALKSRWAVLIAEGGADRPAATNLAMIAELAFVRWLKLPRSPWRYESAELAKILSEIS